MATLKFFLVFFLKFVAILFVARNMILKVTCLILKTAIRQLRVRNSHKLKTVKGLTCIV